MEKFRILNLLYVYRTPISRGLIDLGDLAFILNMMYHVDQKVFFQRDSFKRIG